MTDEEMTVEMGDMFHEAWLELPERGPGADEAVHAPSVRRWRSARYRVGAGR